MNPPVDARDAGDAGSFLGQEDPLEKETTTHSSIFAWEIPWSEVLAGYSPWGPKELSMTGQLSMHYAMIRLLSL